MIIIDALRMYKDGASISHRGKKHYRCVKSVLGWCFNISQRKKSL